MRVAALCSLLVLGGCAGGGLNRVTGDPAPDCEPPPVVSSSGAPTAQRPSPAPAASTARPAPTAPARGPMQRPRRGGRPVPGETISLSAGDLAPVDSYFHARNSQWLIGDDVEIVASREYFATALTLTSPSNGYVEKHSGTVGDEEVTTLTFRGPKNSASITTSPRAMIGTGITVMARNRLTLRMRKTSNPDVPVSLRATANGGASRGVRNAVLERQQTISLGGTLKRRGKGYEWEPIGTPR